jgi:hypothetical protein
MLAWCRVQLEVEMLTFHLTSSLLLLLLLPYSLLLWIARILLLLLGLLLLASVLQLLWYCMLLLLLLYCAPDIAQLLLLVVWLSMLLLLRLLCRILHWVVSVHQHALDCPQLLVQQLYKLLLFSSQLGFSLGLRGTRADRRQDSTSVLP